MRLMLK